LAGVAHAERVALAAPVAMSTPLTIAAVHPVCLSAMHKHLNETAAEAVVVAARPLSRSAAARWLKRVSPGRDASPVVHAAPRDARADVRAAPPDARAAVPYLRSAPVAA
jgi:hypothetical protein